MHKYITILFLFLFNTILVYAQTPLQHSVKIDSQKSTVGQLLKQITEKTGVSFSYKSTIISLDEAIQIKEGEQTIQSILDQIFAGKNIEYIELNNQIIFRKKEKKSTKRTISGYVKEKGSGELLLGVNIYSPALQVGTSTNTYGFYSLTIPASQDSITIIYSYVGYQSISINLAIDEPIEKNVDLAPMELHEVIVEDTRIEKESEAIQMSKIDIPITQIKSIPAFLGEKDVLKVLQLMPGVQKGSEGSSGIYVRGGGPDQNLLILDDAVVYNAMHLFGFFSVFNGDALKSVELIKGGFPARYGGRLSSVIDMNMKDGNKEKIHGEGGIGLIASRLTLEGPLLKNKSSFLISGRRTYADLLIKPFLSKDEKFGYYFYDLNTKVNYDINGKNKIYLSSYFGRDRFLADMRDQDSRTITTIGWGNATATFRWNHQFTNKIFSNTSIIFSDYNFRISSDDRNGNRGYYLEYNSGIRDIAVKYDMDFLPSTQHTIKMGVMSTHHLFTPSASVAKIEGNYQDTPFTIPPNEKLEAIEIGIYMEDLYKINSHLKINPGLRLSNFLVDTKSYFLFEPRFGASYQFNKDWTIKGSYASMNQYIHLLSNSGIGLPTDLWVPTTNKIAPQHSEQIALGFVKDINQISATLSVEGYYKQMNRIITYKEGANFLQVLDFNPTTEVKSWQDNIVQGNGVSYGAEFLLQKKVGRFSGWIGYTLSWTIVQFDEINFGRPYYARYDRRHDISLVGIYEITPKITVSATWVYGTGNAITMPLSNYVIEYPSKSLYSTEKKYTYYGDEKNSFRMAPYHRLDLGIQFHKKMKRHERTWEFSIYNAYSRQNPYFYYIDGNKLKQVSIFPIIPSFSYNFKF